MSGSACRLAASAGIVAFCLWRLAVSSVPAMSPRAYSYIADWRGIAAGLGVGKAALLCADASDLTPVDRSRLAALSWELGRNVPRVVGNVFEIGDVDCLATSAYMSPVDRRRLEESGMSVAAANGSACAWRRATAQGTMPAKEVPSAFREAASLAVVVSLLALCWLLGRGFWRGGASPSATAFAAAVFVTMGVVAVSHPLTPPNGLGVYGGKAKLVFECGGVPEGFWRLPLYSHFQPAYPPGLTIVSLLHFALSGGCGDRLVQLVVPFALALLLLEMSWPAGGWRAALPAAMFAVSPVGVRLSSGFYAEPFAALSLLVGWNAMRKGRVFSGAVAMGLTALFRPEGGVVALVFAAAYMLSAPQAHRSWKGVALLFAVAAVWPAFCLCVGCRLPDWDLSRRPDGPRIVYAAWCAAKALAMQALPAAALAVLLSRRSRARRSPMLSAAVLAAATLMALAVVACGFHDSPYSSWMVRSTIPRVVWCLSVIPLAEILRHGAGARHDAP